MRFSIFSNKKHFKIEKNNQLGGVQFDYVEYLTVQFNV
jgi:hypothetical protein